VKRPVILLVDDDPKLTKLVAMFLCQSGVYRVHQENNSRNAALNALACRPDVVILNLEMPGKSGDEVASEFQADPRLQNVPLIFMSGSIAHDETRIRNGQVYLPKPYPLRLIQQVVRIATASRHDLE
jgi:CheY-like chemotaxis protein